MKNKLKVVLILGLVLIVGFTNQNYVNFKNEVIINIFSDHIEIDISELHLKEKRLIKNYSFLCIAEMDSSKVSYHSRSKRISGDYEKYIKISTKNLKYDLKSDSVQACYRIYLVSHGYLP